MNLGEALHAFFLERVDQAEELWDTPQAAAESLAEYYGSTSAAARELGVPRRTFRDWASGRSSPRGGGGWLMDLARDLVAEMFGDEDDEMLGDSIGIHGDYVYSDGTQMRGAEERSITLELRRGTMNRVHAAWKAGASQDELAELFHAGITDHGFYEATFDPAGSIYGGQWDIHSIGAA